MATKKIRVYELARELGVENHVVLELSEELKIGVKSHSSSIDNPSADRVRRLADSKGLRREPIVEEKAAAKGKSEPEAKPEKKPAPVRSGRALITPDVTPPVAPDPAAEPAVPLHRVVRSKPIPAEAPLRPVVVPAALALEDMAEDERLRRRAVQQRQRHARVRRVVDAPLPLDEEPVVPGVVHDKLLGDARGEVGDGAVDAESLAGDHDAGLAGREELRVAAARPELAREHERRAHLADVAVRADREDSAVRERPSAVPPARDQRHHAQVVDAHPVFLRKRREFRVLAENLVQAVGDGHPGLDRLDDDLAISRDQHPADVRDADDEFVGAKLRRFGDARDDGDSLSEPEELID